MAAALAKRASCSLLVRRVDDLDVVALVARHHLIARDALQHGVHDRPLRRGELPALVGFRLAAASRLRPGRCRTSACPSSTKTRLQTIQPGLLMPLSVPPPRRKYIGGWRSLRRAFVAADEMRRRRGAGDEEHPDVVIRALVLVVPAPAQIVQRVFRRKAEFAPELVGDEAIEAGAFVDFVEVRQRFALEKFPPVTSCVAPADGRRC